MLSVFGVYYSIKDANFSLLIDSLSKVSIANILVLVFISTFIYVADSIRYIVFARASNNNLSFRQALETSMGNFLFAWVTPGAALGAPASIYLLTSYGINLSNSIFIAIGKSISGFLVFLPMALAFYVLDMNKYPKETSIYILVLTIFLYLLTPLMCLFISINISFFKRFQGTHQFIDKLIEVGEKIDELSRKSISHIFLIICSHILYFFFFILVGAYLAKIFGGDFFSSFKSSSVFTAMSMTVPTPGGAGVSEAFGGKFFSHLIGLENGLLVVILFRTFTFYFQIFLGLIYFIRKGIISLILERARS